MPEIIMHLSCLTTVPAWEGDVFQPRVGWLNAGQATASEPLNSPIQNYIERYQEHPISIHGLGILRPMRRAAMFEHRIWRRVLQMDRNRHQFDLARLHLAPLILRPRQRLQVVYHDVHSATLSIYVTPLAVRTQAIVTFALGSIEQVNEIKAAACMLDGQPAGKLAQVLLNLHRQALAGLFAAPQLERPLAREPKWHCAISLDNPLLDLDQTARQLKNKHVINGNPRPARYDWEEGGWKLIGQRDSITLIDAERIKAARARASWAHHKSCHFNNWNDLRFIYESLYYSFTDLRDWLDRNPGQPARLVALTRLNSLYTAYASFREDSGWSPVIDALEACYKSAHTLTDVYERIRWIKIIPPAEDYDGRYAPLSEADLIDLRGVHQANLGKLERQAAHFGSNNVPLWLSYQIEDERKEIKDIDSELSQRGLVIGAPAAGGVRRRQEALQSSYN